MNPDALAAMTAIQRVIDRVQQPFNGVRCSTAGTAAAAEHENKTGQKADQSEGPQPFYEKREQKQPCTQ